MNIVNIDFFLKVRSIEVKHSLSEIPFLRYMVWWVLRNGYSHVVTMSVKVENIFVIPKSSTL